MSDRRQIVILIDTQDTWGRRVIRGISQAVRASNRPWDLLIAPRDSQWRLRAPDRWRGEGVIAALRDEQSTSHVKALSLPTVNVSTWGVSLEWCKRVSTDDRLRSRMAFEHFRERGFTNFVYYGPPSQRYSAHRGIHFQEEVLNAGFDWHTFQAGKSHPSWNELKKQTLVWLLSLPRPLAIFAANPHPALQLTEICKVEGIAVPSEVAILAGDTDDLLCDVSDPPLSSIVLASETIGHHAVEILDQLMEKKKNIPEVTLIPPVRVQERASTELLAIDDPLLVQSIRYIREHAKHGITVGDVLRVVPISRRLLEQKFARILKRTPADEIRLVRMEHVKQLLSTTDMAVYEIAYETGFSSPSRFCVAFRQSTGMSPMEYRLQLQR